MGKKKILIIDDEPELVKAVSIRLKAGGYEVAFAHDGLEGLKKVSQVRPDIILLDLIMPGMDGYGVCKELLSAPETKNIPIIIFSASQQTETENKCRGLGLTHFLNKPFDNVELLSLIDNILKSK